MKKDMLGVAISWLTTGRGTRALIGEARRAYCLRELGISEGDKDADLMVESLERVFEAILTKHHREGTHVIGE